MGVSPLAESGIGARDMIAAWEWFSDVVFFVPR